MKRKVKLAPGDAFVKLTRDLVERDVWATLSGNAYRLVVFLIREHLRCGGRQNGRLLAPYRQLEKFGIRKKSVAAAIEEAEAAGLVEVLRAPEPSRGPQKTPNLYALTWLPRGKRQGAKTPLGQGAKTPPLVGAKTPPQRQGAKTPPLSRIILSRRNVH